MLDISFWIFSMYSMEYFCSILQQIFETKACVPWRLFRASWIFFSYILNDHSRKIGSCWGTYSSPFFFIWSTSIRSSGDGEFYLGSSLYDTRPSSRWSWEIFLATTSSKMFSMSTTYRCEHPSIGTPQFKHPSIYALWSMYTVECALEWYSIV